MRRLNLVLLAALALTAPLLAQRGTPPRRMLGDPSSPSGQALSPTAMPYNVRDYGAKCDGVTDDAPAIRAAMTAASANGGGAVFIPPAVCLVGSTVRITQHNIHLAGQWGWGVQDVPYPPSRLFAPNLNAPVIDVSAGVVGFSVTDLAISGSGHVQPKSMGIRDTAAVGPFLARLFFDYFGLSAIQLGTPAGTTVIGATVLDVFAQNCLLSRPAVDTGCLDLNAADLMMERIFATASVPASAGGIGNGHTFAIAWRGSNGYAAGNMAELSQKGWLVSGSQNRFIGNRAFLNQAEGMVVTGSNNTFVATEILSNSQNADSGAPGITVTGGGNAFTATYIDGFSSDDRKQANGISDRQMVGSAEAQINTYIHSRMGSNVRGVLYSSNGTGIRIEHPHRVSADRGDHNVTLVPFVDAETQIFNTPLSGNRTVRLDGNGTAKYPKGARFRVVRTAAATGSAVLSVVGGTSKALAAGQWVDFELSDALQWMEVGFGSL